MPSVGTDSLGKPGLRIPSLYLRAVLELLIAGGIQLRAKGIVTASMWENRITYHLDNEMELLQRTSQSDIVSWDVRVNTQANPADPMERCETDFKFRWAEYPNDNRRHLVAEAKRLFGHGDSLAGKYVDEGVMDFVLGKYSPGHNFGIMLGYVLKGPLTVVIKSVQRAMTDRSAATLELSSFQPDASLCSHPHTHHSGHHQTALDSTITLIHIFLDFS